MTDITPPIYKLAMGNLDKPPRYPMDGMKICTRQSKHPCSCDTYTAYHEHYSHWKETQEQQQTQNTRQSDPINIIYTLIMTTTLALIATVIILVWAVTYKKDEKNRRKKK